MPSELGLRHTISPSKAPNRGEDRVTRVSSSSEFLIITLAPFAEMLKITHSKLLLRHSKLAGQSTLARRYLRFSAVPTMRSAPIRYVPVQLESGRTLTRAS